MLQLSFVNYRKGSYLFVEGKSDSDRFLIIQNGRVQCHQEVEIPGSTSVILGPGDFVGVIPCMSNHLQIETVIALTDVTCISVRRDQYSELIERNTPVAMKIIRTFANRMRTLNETLTQLTLNNVIQDSPEELYEIAVHYEKALKYDIAVYGYYQYIKSCPNGVNINQAKARFVALKPRSKAVYFESSPDLQRVYPKGTMIFSECQSGSDMFIIQEGQVLISKVVDNNEVALAVLKKGDMFGEMALLENKPRSASAIAHEDCRLMVVNRKNFDQMVATQPQLIARLTTTLAERLWSMYRQLANTQMTDPVHKLVDRLSLEIEKSKTPLTPNAGYQSDLSLQDLANMCGIPMQNQAKCILDFQNLIKLRIQNNRIFVLNSLELVKLAAYYRNHKQTKQSDK